MEWLKKRLVPWFVQDPFTVDIKRAKDTRTLLRLLMMRQDVKRFDKIVRALEKAVYENETIDLKKMKQSILKVYR